MEGVLSPGFLKGEDRQAIGKSIPKGREEKKGIHLFTNMFKRVQDSQEEHRSSHWTAQALVLADNCSGQNSMPLAEHCYNKDCLITAEDCFTGSGADKAIPNQWLLNETGPAVLQMVESENFNTEGLGLYFRATNVQDSNIPQQLTSVSGQSTSADGQGSITFEGGENVYITINQSHIIGHHGPNTDGAGIQAQIIDDNGTTNNALYTTKTSAGPKDLEAVIMRLEALETSKTPEGLRETKAEFMEMVSEDIQIRDKTTLDSVESAGGIITKAGDGYENTNVHKNPEGDEDVKFGPSDMDLANFDAMTSFKMKMPDGQVYTEGNYDRSILEQISSAVIKQKGSNKSWELLLKLEPESLGKVMVKLTLKGDSMVAKFLASNQETRQIIEMNCQQLEQALNNQGFNISKVEVSGMDYESNSLLDNPYERGGQSSNNKGYTPSDDGGHASEYRDKKIEEVIRPYDLMEESSVNYFA
ncbi:MAG: flagellar hook-length control protein FliK [Mahellales bacterium]